MNRLRDAIISLNHLTSIHLRIDLLLIANSLYTAIFIENNKDNPKRVQKSHRSLIYALFICWLTAANGALADSCKQLTVNGNPNWLPFFSHSSTESKGIIGDVVFEAAKRQSDKT